MEDDGLSAKRFGRLLFFLLGYLFISPAIPHSDSSASIPALAVQGLLSLMLFFAACAVQQKRNQRSIALTVMGIALVVYWLSLFDIVAYSAEGSLLLFILFYAFLIYSFGRQLLSSKRVNGGVIITALCLYLIIGLLWGASYTLLNSLYNNQAFSGALLETANIQTSQLHLFNYFSMVTLTTLGYGDITPQVPEAASLCQMEAIVGQFYTAVLVAWLVGMYGKPLKPEE